MEKKTYLKPRVRVKVIEADATLMAGSDPTISTSKTNLVPEDDDIVWSKGTSTWDDEEQE